MEKEIRMPFTEYEELLKEIKLLKLDRETLLSGDNILVIKDDSYYSRESFYKPFQIIKGEELINKTLKDMLSITNTRIDSLEKRMCKTETKKKWYHF